jgi:hypothetical protein
MSAIGILLGLLRAFLLGRADVAAENVALRQQLAAAGGWPYAQLRVLSCGNARAMRRNTPRELTA